MTVGGESGTIADYARYGNLPAQRHSTPCRFFLPPHVGPAGCGRRPETWLPSTYDASTSESANAARSILRTTGSRNPDASLFMDLRLREHRRVEIRTEAFSLTNTPTFTLPPERSPDGGQCRFRQT